MKRSPTAVGGIRNTFARRTNRTLARDLGWTPQDFRTVCTPVPVCAAKNDCVSANPRELARLSAWPGSRWSDDTIGDWDRLECGDRQGVRDRRPASFTVRPGEDNFGAP